MVDFKQIIGNSIAKATQIEESEITSYIEVPKDLQNGDYAFPCFKLAKTLKKAPPVIANEIKEKLEIDQECIKKVDIAGGYLNFYINKDLMAQEVINNLETQENYGSSKIGDKKTVVIDYSSPNIAKPFHIGHLKTTVIGGALYNIYQYLGYNVIGVNHLGDYGTQFGKLIEGYKRWGQEYDLSSDAIEKLAEMYVRINNLCKEDEEVLELCRENFKLLEEGDEYCVKLWNEFKTLSIKEFQKVYDLLGSKFDSWNGEAFYADKTRRSNRYFRKVGKT